MMKKKAKIRWLREVATWLRAAAGAPSVLLVMVWAGNGVLALMGKASSFDPVSDLTKVGAPAALAAGAVYVVFSAAATKLEILADELEEESGPRIIVERNRSRRKSGRDDAS